MIDYEILQDIITDHELCKVQENELAKVVEMLKSDRLIELPCLPDEIVWEVHKYYPARQTMYCSYAHILESMEAGYGIGYTKEEAEARLEELKNEQERRI